MLKQVGATTPFLPADKPRYTMGLGTPPQLVKMIALGVDMFDCVLPTRVARNGLVFTPDGPMNLRNETIPRGSAADRREAWPTTREFLARLSAASARSPAKSLSPTLLTIHNLHFLPRSDDAGAGAHRGRRLRLLAPRMDRAVRSRAAARWRGSRLGGTIQQESPRNTQYTRKRQRASSHGNFPCFPFSVGQQG
jgi:hypothetical protein